MGGRGWVESLRKLSEVWRGLRKLSEVWRGVYIKLHTPKGGSMKNGPNVVQSMTLKMVKLKGVCENYWVLCSVCENFSLELEVYTKNIPIFHKFQPVPLLPTINVKSLIEMIYWWSIPYKSMMNPLLFNKLPKSDEKVSNWNPFLLSKWDTPLWKKWGIKVA